MSRPDVLIIGAGPAGIAAAVQAVRLGLSVRLIDERGEPGGLVREAYCVENYPGLEPLSGVALVERLAAHLLRFGVNVERARAEAISPTASGYGVATDVGVCQGRSVIVAVGTRARPLLVPGGGEACTSLSDAQKGGPVESALIVGGGEASFDYALSLARQGAAVRVAVRGPRPRVRGRLAALVAQHPSVEVRCACQLTNARRCGGRWELELTGPGYTSTVEAAVLLAAVGRRSEASALLPGLDLSAVTGITTTWPGLLLVGDARCGSLGQVGMAVGDGLAAAMRVASGLARLGHEREVGRSDAQVDLHPRR